MAEKESSPLHKLFEWNDSVAAVAYRKMQARSVIKQYNIKIEDPGKKVVHIPSINNGEGVYKEANAVVRSVSDFELAMDEALKRLKAAESSVSTLQEVAQEKEPDKAGILAIVMKGLNTATVALSKLH